MGGQGLIAAGSNPAAVRTNGHSPFDYLAHRQARDGHYRYSSSSDQTPVWVTGQVLLAVNREAFPLAAVPRTPIGAGSGSGAGVGAGVGGPEPSEAGGAATRGQVASGRGSGKPAGAAPPRNRVRGELASGEPEGVSVAPAAAAPDDDGGLGTSAYVGGGFALLTAALAGGFLWYRRRLP